MGFYQCLFLLLVILAPTCSSSSLFSQPLMTPFKKDDEKCQRTKPPYPGITPTKYFKPSKFYRHYSSMYGQHHQSISGSGRNVTLKIDKSSGSSFKSKVPYMYGFFNAAIKLQSGFTAGVVTSFYLSNSQVYKGWHDEIDFEFMGTIPGETILLQTNMYANGTGDGKEVRGREQRFVLWFDPTTDFHNYSVMWSPNQIIFFVDNIPIRRIPKINAISTQFPSKPMSVYATIWDGSSWATDNGKHHSNFKKGGPVESQYSNFIVYQCKTKNCSHGFPDILVDIKPTEEFNKSLKFVQDTYKVYDFCDFSERRTPECSYKSKDDEMETDQLQVHFDQRKLHTKT